MTAPLLVLVCCGFLPLSEALASSRLRQIWEEIGLFEPGVRTDYKVVHPNVAYKLKEDALVEAGLTCNNISLYGALAPKIPQSIVAAVDDMKLTSGTKKTHNYNFIGVVADKDPRPDRERRRQWILDFAETNITQDDVLVYSGKEIVGGKDFPICSTKAVANAVEACPGFDPQYYMTMILSNFTLCPGGDAPWSERFYEAILAHSIPVIKDLEEDWAVDYSWARFVHFVGYKYVTLEQLSKETMSTAKMKSITDHNYELFLKYQTFIFGDQVPPAWAGYGGPCLSDDGCRERCLDKDYEDMIT
mmetsp:Transcript_29112/g.63655  ORF Transcript_29112/g.63655 Transcript_29112/m.63655 type:complete len:303 (-) Transcript_29112:66-974(-)